MKPSRVCLCVLMIGAAGAQEPFSVPASDAPELAARGPYAVGVRTLELVHADQIDILRFDKETGKAPASDRRLTVEVWYPSAQPKTSETNITYKMKFSAGGSGGPGEIDVPGRAIRDAEPFVGRRFPLVIVSHGYPGSRYFLTYLTENLASKGYVVAAIDHTDSVFGEVRAFPSTLLNRSADQMFTLAKLAGMSGDKSSFLYGLIEEGDAAIVGYSMGGYGAILSAGAGLSPASPLNKYVPGGYLRGLDSDSGKFKTRKAGGLKAIVAIAPWGAQAPFHAWDAAGLAAIRIPALFIAGDHDDVAGFEDGPKKVVREAVNSNRCLLVYENARHNTGGNPAPEIPLDYKLMQTFDEPVWRKDRITAINEHFITAFLDVYLKGDQSRMRYLRVPLEKSDDGKWETPPNTPDDGQFSTGAAFWPGFQRRWALGLEMICADAGQAAK